MSARIPIIAIIGRPNVGKSTLFNHVLGRNKAVVEDVEGVTRDRNYAHVTRYSISFYVVDTGGFDLVNQDDIQQQVVQQARLAVEEADLLWVMFDGNSGVSPKDSDVVDLVRRSNKPAFYLVNKCDGAEQQLKVIDFYSLGLGEIYDISALHGHGVRKLVEDSLSSHKDYQVLLQQRVEQLEQESRERAEEAYALEEAGLNAEDLEPHEDDVEFDELVPDDTEPNFAPVMKGGDAEDVERYESEFRLRPLSEIERKKSEDDDEPLVEEEIETPLPAVIRLALIGRPNVGKSTLLNTIVGSQRAITSPLAGTTRDSVDALFTRDGQDYLIVDTAGLRKKGRISESIEQFSTMRSLRAISDCDVAVVLLDAVEGPTEQDAKIVGVAHSEGKGILLVINKWDLIEKDHKSVTEFKEKVKDTFKFATYAPMTFISAKSGKRVPGVIEEVNRLARQRLKKVNTGVLNRLLERGLRRVSAPTFRGRPVKMLFATQVAVAPPRFVLFFNQPKGVHFSMLRFIKNTIREHYSFHGTDLKLVVRKRRSAEEGEGRGARN